MYIAVMEQANINLTNLTLPEETQSFYTSLYKHYDIEPISRLHIPHHMLVDSLFRKMNISINIEKIFYTYDRAQYYHRYKSLGCYVAHQYQLTSNFFDICDQYTMAEFITFYISDSYIKQNTLSNVLLISIDCPVSSTEGLIYGLLLTNYVSSENGFFLTNCEFLNLTDVEIGSLFKEFVDKHKSEFIYTNYLNFNKDKNIYSYEKTFQALFHFGQNSTDRAIIIHFEERTNNAAIVYLNKVKYENF